MVGSRLGRVLRIFVLAVLAVVSLEVAAAAQDVSSCIIRRCTSSETCVSVDVRRCVNPNPRIVEGVCTFATPVPGCENPDTDGDGLADVWEENQAIDINCDGVYDSNDVVLPGANKYVKDVYLKISWMESAPDEIPGVHKPSNESIKTVMAAFAGSHLKSQQERCDATTACSSGSVCSDFVCLPACTTDAECGSVTDDGRCVDGFCQLRRLHVDPQMSMVPHSTVMSYGPVNDACITGGASSDPSKAVNFYDIKAGDFEPNDAIFKRYGVFGHYNTCDSPETCAVCPVATGGSPHPFGTSGVAEITGNDFMVTLAAFQQTPTSEALQMREAGSLMHELGHNLGLNHSGAGSSAGGVIAPNHLSVMNYLYNFGIPTTDTPGAITLSGRIAIDFSHAGLGDLDELSLNESKGVSPGFQPPWDKYLVRYFPPIAGGATRYGSTHPGTPIDWNGNGSIETQATVDVNKNGAATDFFAGTEEWSRLVYSFQCTSSFADGAHLSTLTMMEEEATFFIAQDLGILDPPIVSVRLEVSKECIDVSSNGVVPITLYGSQTFPITNIDLSTVRLNNAAAVSTSISDKDGDGYMDLSGRFRSNQMQLATSSTVATLTGRLTSGQEFQAYDTVKVVTGNPAQCKQ